MAAVSGYGYAICLKNNKAGGCPNAVSGQFLGSFVLW